MAGLWPTIDQHFLTYLCSRVGVQGDVVCCMRFHGWPTCFESTSVPMPDHLWIGHRSVHGADMVHVQRQTVFTRLHVQRSARPRGMHETFGCVCAMDHTQQSRAPVDATCNADLNPLLLTSPNCWWCVHWWWQHQAMVESRESTDSDLLLSAPASIP